MQIQKASHLLALEEPFPVTVGKVQRQSHYTRSVLHSLNDPIQFSPAWTLLGNDNTGLWWRHTVVTGHSVASIIVFKMPPPSRNVQTYKFRLMLVDGQRGVIHGGAHVALLAELVLLLFAHRVDFFTVHNVFGKQWHFGWLQLLCNLCGYGVLMRLAICTGDNNNTVDYYQRCFWTQPTDISLHSKSCFSPHGW